jgi:hypothetical protein
MKKYRIINDAGVDYGMVGDSRSWIGQIVSGGPSPSFYPDAISVEKPFGLIGSYTASACNFEEIVEN